MRAAVQSSDRSQDIALAARVVKVSLSNHSADVTAHSQT